MRIADRMIRRRNRCSINVLRCHKDGGWAETGLHHVTENGDFIVHGARPVIKAVDDDVFFFWIHFELLTKMAQIARITDFLMGGRPVER